MLRSQITLPLVTSLSIVAFALGGCGAGRGCAPSAAEPLTAKQATAAHESPLGVRRVVVFSGMCDASGAVQLSDRRFAVADDEDNVQRVYDAQSGGAPLAARDLSPALGLAKKGKRGTWPEMDLEAGTRIGDRAYWITSHGRNKKGKLKPERLRFFATRISGDAEATEMLGSSDGLLHELIEAPGLARFELGRAAELAPKAEGGLNIEGLSAMPDGRLLIGFRNPNPNGQALLVPLSNPDAVISGARAEFGQPVLLNLEGRGVRAITLWRGSYLIVAGHFANALPSRLYTWDGKGEAKHVAQVAFGDEWNPEGFFSPETSDELMVLSDDGEVEVDGKPCKDLADAGRKSFRGAWLRL
jgi:hypothetical protein